MSLKTSCTAILALSLLTAPAVWAQGNSGVSVHTKTVPSAPPPAAAPAQPVEQPAQPQAQPAAPAPAAQPVQAAAPATGTQPPQAGPAQQNAAPPTPPNPLGAGGGWSPQFSTTPTEGSVYTGAPEQVALIQKIDGFFNTMKNLEGNFVQTDPDGKHKKGKFYLERPGKVRFDYSLPSKQKIISDGRYLALEDHDLGTTDRHALESTPFRMLLTEKVDLLGDARVIALDAGPELTVVTLEDKKSDMGGQIRLFFSSPQLLLKEWLVTDAQGLTTRIELTDVELNKPTDPKLFTFSPDLGLPKFKGSSN